MEPKGSSSLSHDEENLARLAAIAEAVSEQKLPVASDNTSVDDDLQQESSHMRISDVLRKRGHGVARLSETHTSVASSPGFNLPPSTTGKSHDSHLPLLANRNRFRVEYSSSGNEQRTSPTIKAAGLQKPPHQTEQIDSQHETILESSSEIGNKAHQSVPSVKFREYQAEIWSQKFEELCGFRRSNGHCHVPHRYGQNTGLAQWVKRQRYQYKLKVDGKRSTLSDERVRLLNKIGFIWNSHDAVWEERLQELLEFKRVHGICTVPSNYEENPQLAVWTKRQRRQYKKYKGGTSSSMTQERISKLESIGFVWGCRKVNNAYGAVGNTTGVTGSAITSADSIFVPKDRASWNKIGNKATIANVVDETDHTNTKTGISLSATLGASSNEPSNTRSTLGSSISKNAVRKGDAQGQTPLSPHGSAQPSNRMHTSTGYLLSYQSSNSSRNSKIGLPLGINRAKSPPSFVSPVASFSSSGTEYSNSQVQMRSPGKTASKLEEEKLCTTATGSPIETVLTGKEQQKKQQKKNHSGPHKTTKCDFYCFSHTYQLQEKNKPP